MAAQINHLPKHTNAFCDLVPDQKFALISAITLDSGEELKSCPVAYKTWGVLNEKRDNVLVVCHALSGSSDVKDWWGPLMGPGKAFDYTRYFVFCGNLLGSPYGSASPVTINPETGVPYGRDFPATSIRDDVRAHKLVLDALGVHSVAAVIGGSMGGMAALEWPLCTPTGYIKNIVPVATSADHSAWGISWALTQKQCIYADANFRDGCYDIQNQPEAGLSAARMVAMLTYRSCISFDRRFGRKPPSPKVANKAERESQTDAGNVSGNLVNGFAQDLRHDVFRSPNRARVEACSGFPKPAHRSQSPTFSAQGYLNYQGEKFIRRFDANCYINLTNKMDTHDVTRDRTKSGNGPDDEALIEVFKTAPSGALVVSVDTDNLFQPDQQIRLARVLPDATLAMLQSLDGHDGFLLEFESLNKLIIRQLKDRCPSMYQGPPLLDDNTTNLTAVKDSVFGEVESGW